MADTNHSARRIAGDRPLGMEIASCDLDADSLKVAESGIGSGADVRRLAQAGFDAFLIGESLLLADDPAAKLAELTRGALSSRVSPRSEG